MQRLTSWANSTPLTFAGLIGLLGGLRYSALQSLAQSLAPRQQLTDTSNKVAAQALMTILTATMSVCSLQPPVWNLLDPNESFWFRAFLMGQF